MVGGESARTVVGGMLVMLADRGRGSLRWVGMPVSAMMTVRLGFLFLGDSAIGELVEDEWEKECLELKLAGYYEAVLLLPVGGEAVADLSNGDLRLKVLIMVPIIICSIESYKHTHT